MEPIKLKRKSLSGTDYQIEYIPARKGEPTEYRVRRGGYGTWTRWISTNNVFVVLKNLGYNDGKPLSTKNDFEFEAILGRGTIMIEKRIVKRLSKTVSNNPLSAHVYSRLKKLDDNTWVIHSSAVTDPEVFKFVRKLI